MANFSIPNLCGASPDLNGALDEINKLKDKLTANIDVDASALKADLETGLADLKGAFDKLEVELPEVPNVNFQAEITSLINDIDKTTIEGLVAFNAKLEQLETDFGNTLKEKGLTLDSLVTDATTKLSTGGNVCDLAPNIEIPAANSGSGVTTEEKEERGSGTSITISETPKEIVSVQGKKVSQSFFTNVTHKQSGRTFTTTQRDADNNLISYAELKVTYIINLVKEKPIATKQASKDGEKEEPSIITTNSVAVEKNVQGKIQSLLKKIDMKGISGLATEKENAGIQAAIGKLKDGSFKEQMQKDIAAAKEEQKKIWQDPLNYKRVVPPNPTVASVSSNAVKAAQDAGASISSVASSNKENREVKVTSTANRNTVTTTTKTTSNGSTITTPKTEKTVVSKDGFASRKVRITEYFKTADVFNYVTPDGNFPKTRKRYKLKKYKEVDDIGRGVELKQTPFGIDYMVARVWTITDGVAGYRKFFYKRNGNYTSQEIPIMRVNVAFVKDSNPPKVIFLPEFDAISTFMKAQILMIKYTVLEKVDPNFSG